MLSQLVKGLVDGRPFGIVSVTEFGAVGDGVTDDTAAIQAAIDAINAKFVLESNSYGGGVLYFPPGRYAFTEITLKPGVSILGAGRFNTLLICTLDGAVGLKNPSAVSQSYRDQVAWSRYADFTLLASPSIEFSQPTVLWDMTGFSHCVWERVAIKVKPNVTGMRMTGATRSGMGGPAQWYNSFYDCFLLAAGGGVCADLGDSDINFEQITTWDFYGGRVALVNPGTATGIKLNGATGVKFFGVTFEGLETGLIIGSPTGTRHCYNINLFSCYFEGGTSSTNGYVIHPNAHNTLIVGGYSTGVTNIDNGKSTAILNPNEIKLPVGEYFDRFVLTQIDGARAPKVRGSFAGWLFDDPSGVVAGFRTAGAHSQEARIAQIFQEGGPVLFEIGTRSADFFGKKILGVAWESGPTESRPASPGVGYRFFDTTLGKPIWYNGAAWVDAMGTPV